MIKEMLDQAAKDVPFHRLLTQRAIGVVVRAAPEATYHKAWGFDTLGYGQTLKQARANVVAFNNTRHARYTFDTRGDI